MRDLSLCLRPVEGGTLERLESHDPRFLTVADLVQREAYVEAADAIEALDGEGVYEVRLSAYYLFAVLREDGLARLPEVLEVLVALSRAAAEEVEQGEGKDKSKPAVLLNKALTWLFQVLVSALKYHHGKRDAGWEAWTKGFTDGKRKDALRGIQTLQGALEGPAFRNGAQGLAGLGQWLRETTQERAAAPAPAPEPAKPAAPAKGRGAKNSAAAAATPPSPFPRTTGPLQLRGSVHLLELCDKLKAFEVLVERGDFQKAAMVSDDVLRTLEEFDPRRYLPELFSSFGALLNRHVGDIQEHWERKETMEWRTLSQFYQVDLGAFVGPGE
ncbi:hypothetical protein HJC10_20080 [Corallococcus exiguus]|uniref:type VI secretion system protein IglI family protein n=1 Tax=Corallococcus exiguus TaxID=83462 RepID=UPI0014725856|nr:type VI secretion system protein IglI family protein [Corallococcus exiguus]NNB92623.1 hypothetical protein [Corallococcus exiguus]NNC05141.1 hypothetical protein [Corallococcus exiguus]